MTTEQRPSPSKVKVRSTSSLAAKYHRHAKAIGWSLLKLGGSAGSKKEVLDGFIFSARKSGGRVTVDVVEPAGSVALVGPYDGFDFARIPAPNRDFFSPLTPLREEGSFGERIGITGEAFAIGPPPPTNTSRMAVGQGFVGRHHVYYPNTRYIGALTSAGLPSAVIWLRVLVGKIGAAPRRDSFFIHQSVLQAAAPGYDAVPRNQASAFEQGALPVASICELGDLVIVSVQVYREYQGGNGVWKVNIGVVVLAIDTTLRAVAWTAFQSSEDMPSGFVPQPIVGSALGADIDTYSQSSFYNLQAAPRGSNAVQVTAYYTLQRATTIPSSGDLAIVPVMAVADMTFTPGNASVEMLHADVRAPASDPIVAELGANPGYLLRALLPRNVNNEVVVEAYRYQRPADWGWPIPGPAFSEEAPYSYLFHGATMIADGETLGSLEIRDDKVSNSIGTILNPNQFGAEPAPFTVAYKGREIESRAVGVTFADPTRAKFEQLVPTYAGTIIGELVSVTCPQREVRNDEGELIIPCVLIALFSVGAMDDTFIGVRKGPIWADDGAVEDHLIYWRFYPIADWAQLGAVYLGNPLSTAAHGEFYA